MAWPILAGIAKGLGAASAIKSGSLGKREEMPALRTPQAPAYNIGGHDRVNLGGSILDRYRDTTGRFEGYF